MGTTLPSASITETIFAVATKFDLCRNRVWEIARSLNDADKGSQLLQILDSVTGEQAGRHKGHDQCTFDFCEHSRLDFTSVSQRHESCCRLAVRGNVKCNIKEFDARLLENALEAGKPTAWLLAGTSLIERPRPFMAISHVWSDGTGAGSWPPGQVNECLYKFFVEIAERFQCQGIWWDTVCVPRAKAARTKAILRMQQNYEDARITLVHDCFLRNWEWINPEIACLAITFSPWFSRGWTALELARSRKVKILFKDGVIKDLDEDILAKAMENPSRRHVVASEVIEGLRRKRINDTNQLLRVLGPRHTSWPRDVAIISGQLVGVSIQPGDTQQAIYQTVLKRIGRISYENLFHNSVTMSNGFSWCPTSLFDLRHSSTPSSLLIEENGDIVGRWDVFQVPDLSERYNWKDTHPLVEARLRGSLSQPADHLLLVVPGPGEDSVFRALLVRAARTGDGVPMRVQFVGPIYFHPPLARGDLCEQRGIPTQGVTISGDVGVGAGTSGEAINYSTLRRSGSIEAGERQRIDLLTASTEGDKSKVESLLKEGNGRGLDIRDDDGNAPVHLAAKNGHVGILELLITPGSDVDIRSARDKKTPLHLAARNGYGEAVRFLLNKAADTNLQDGDTWTALHHAVWNRHDMVVQELLHRGAEPRVQDSLGQNPVHLAADRGDVDIVSILLQNGSVDLVAHCIDGQTALHRAAWACSSEAAKLLLEATTSINGLDVDARDKFERSALHVAAEKGDSSVTRILLQCGATANVQDLNEQTPLHLAAQSGHNAVVPLLLTSHSTDPDLDDKKGLTPLSLAAKYGHIKVAKTLLNGGAHVDSRGGSGRTPLMWASEGGHESMVKVLIEAGADPKAMDGDSQTPLSWAAENGHIGVAKILLDKDVDAEHQITGGRTPLIWAADKGFAEVVELLLERAVNLEFRDVVGRTPLIAAAENGHDAVVKLLLDRGANIEAERDSDAGGTALCQAATNGHETVVRLLLERNANIEAAYPSGDTSLGYAAFGGHEEVVRLLLEKGADVSSVNQRGQTPIDQVFCAERLAIEVLALLLDKGSKLSPAWTNIALRQFAATGREATTKLLLDSGGDVEAKDSVTGQTPLSIAAELGSKAVVTLLLTRGAKVGCKDNWGRTPLLLAFERKEAGIMKVLLENGEEPDSEEHAGEMLLWAAENWHKALAELLLERGADPAFEKVEVVPPGKLKELDVVPPAKYPSPLGVAARNGDVGMVQLLLQKFASLGLDPVVKQEHGETPLYEALSKGHVEVLELLLKEEFVGMWNLRQYYQWLLKIASLGGHETLAKLVLKALGTDKMDDGEAMDPDGRTPLSYAAEGGNKAIMEMLLEFGGDIEFVDYRTGWTPLFYAIGNMEAVKLLLEKGADPSVRDLDGRTVLSRAVTQGQKAVVKLLSERQRGI